MVFYSQSEIDNINNELEAIADAKASYLELENRLISELDLCIHDVHNYDFSRLESLFTTISTLRSSQTRKVAIIVSILKLELEYNDSVLFCYNIKNSQELIDKYTQCTLMLRRLSLNMPGYLQDEAIQYLASVQLSPSAIIKILSNELFEDFQSILLKILPIMEQYWTFSQKSQYAMHIAQCFPSEANLLRVASYCLDASNYKLAYDYLLQIVNPTTQTLELITTLKGIIYER